MKHAHIYVPPPEPDETLHSLLIASYRLSGHANFRKFTQTLFGIASDGRGWSQRFRRLGKYLDPCKKTANALLQGTVQLPYLIPFMPQEVVQIDRLDGRIWTEAAAYRPGWNPFHKAPLNYCPA